MEGVPYTIIRFDRQTQFQIDSEITIKLLSDQIMGECSQNLFQTIDVTTEMQQMKLFDGENLAATLKYSIDVIQIDRRFGRFSIKDNKIYQDLSKDRSFIFQQQLDL